MIFLHSFVSFLLASLIKAIFIGVILFQIIYLVSMAQIKKKQYNSFEVGRICGWDGVIHAWYIFHFGEFVLLSHILNSTLTWAGRGL